MDNAPAPHYDENDLQLRGAARTMTTGQAARGGAPPDGLALEGIHHAYGAAPVIRGVDLAVGRGEVVCLLGPSGCGKTTLLRIAAGLERQDAGRVSVGGAEVAGPGRFVPPEKRGVGLVFQDCALFPHLRAVDNAAFGLATRERRRRRGDARELLERLDIGHLARAYPHELSGGEQRRVALARALAPRPRAMLLDEPFSALDERLRERVRDDTLRLLKEEGVPTLLVTHDAAEAMAMSDRVAVFHRGRIEQVASPEALYEEPERAFVARFIGDNNLLHGRVLSTARDACEVETPGGTVRAFPVHRCAPGDRAILAIRPERVGLARTEMYSNVFEAEIADIMFQGDHLRLKLGLCGNPAFIVKIPNVAGHGAVLRGDRVRVGWDMADCRALPEEGAPQAGGAAA